MSPFFLPGESPDENYVVLRDRVHAVDQRAKVEKMWSVFEPYADSSFRSAAMQQFHQRYWEMYVAVALLHRGHAITKHGNDGPEFSFQVNGQRIWLEAVAPTRGVGADAVPEITCGERYTVPVEQVLLRFTNAFCEKQQRFAAARSKGIVKAEDAYLLAINSRGVPHAPYSGTVPFYIQALLPVGSLAMEIDKATKKVVDSYHNYRPVVKKSNEAEVSTSAFLDPSSAFCTGVLHSAVDAANHPQELGGDFSFLHNPSATHQLGSGVFPWAEQFTFSDWQLQKISRA